MRTADLWLALRCRRIYTIIDQKNQPTYPLTVLIAPCFFSERRIKRFSRLISLDRHHDVQN